MLQTSDEGPFLPWKAGNGPSSLSTKTAKCLTIHGGRRTMMGPKAQTALKSRQKGWRILPRNCLDATSLRKDLHVPSPFCSLTHRASKFNSQVSSVTFSLVIFPSMWLGLVSNLRWAHDRRIDYLADLHEDLQWKYKSWDHTIHENCHPWSLNHQLPNWHTSAGSKFVSLGSLIHRSWVVMVITPCSGLRPTQSKFHARAMQKFRYRAERERDPEFGTWLSAR